MRTAAVTALTRWAIGDGVRVCVHRPHPDRPEPVYAAVSAPGVVTCQRCVNLLLFSVDLHRCDQCHETTTRMCLTGVMQISVLTLLFLVCHACAAKLQQDEKPDAKPPEDPEHSPSPHPGVALNCAMMLHLHVPTAPKRDPHETASRYSGDSRPTPR